MSGLYANGFNHVYISGTLHYNVSISVSEEDILIKNESLARLA